MFAGTSREISSASVGMEGNNSGDAQLLLAWPHGTITCPHIALTRPGLKAELGHLSREPLQTHGCPWVLWPGGFHDQWPTVPAPHPHGTARHPRPVLPSWQSRELCAFSTRIPPGCGETASEIVRRRDQPCPPVPLGVACSLGSGLDAVPLPVLPLHPEGCLEPVPKPIPLSSSITCLTCTSKGFITVSTRPWAGTTGISLPQSSLELKASVLTVMFTSPADTRGVLSPHGTPSPHRSFTGLHQT